MKKHKVIIGGDPGVKNFGICLIEKPNSILFSGMLKNTVTDMKAHDFMSLEKNILLLIKKYRPSLLILERFLGRGLRGNINELVTTNTTIVAVTCMHNNIQVIFVTPSTWKNQLRRERGDLLEKIYAYGKKIGISAHRIDAFLMCIYASNEKPHFTSINKKMIEQLGEA